MTTKKVLTLYTADNIMKRIDNIDKERSNIVLELAHLCGKGTPPLTNDSRKRATELINETYQCGQEMDRLFKLINR